MVGYHLRYQAAFLPKACIYYYNFQHKQQSTRFQPAQVDTVEERNIALQTAEKMCKHKSITTIIS